jgi:predicted nucleic acid-binding protein
MLVDTNIISEFLRPNVTQRLPKTERFVRDALEADELRISFVTHFELLRWQLKQNLQRKGRRTLVTLRQFLDRCPILGLDGAGGAGWTRAAELWASARTHEPSIVIDDADLLIVATAAFHDEQFVTFDTKLVANLEAIGFVRVVSLPRQ